MISSNWGGVVNSEYQEVTVNISSEQILNMGTTPIELLPAPGVDKYYDVDKFFLEYTPGSSNYTIGENAIGKPVILLNGSGFYNFLEMPLDSDKILVQINYPLTMNTLWEIGDATSNISVSFLNQSIGLSYFAGSEFTAGNFTPFDPEDGDGTIRAIIKYKIRTFGE
jgi:hypothetical protein